MIQVGHPGDTGAVTLQDLLFTTTGTTAGAILVEWNIEGTTAGATGMWDVSFP
jgi:glucan 1,3-beta-glucosidase